MKQDLFLTYILKINFNFQACVSNFYGDLSHNAMCFEEVMITFLRKNSNRILLQSMSKGAALRLLKTSALR